MTLLRRAWSVLALAAVACSDSSRLAMGDVNSIIVVAEDSLWEQVADTVLTTLQPRIFAVRDEPTFLLTHTSPTSQYWGDLRRFRQILAIGRPTDPWVQEPLGEADGAVTPPAIVEVDRVWARNQRVTVVVVPEEGAAEVVRSVVDSLAALLDHRYRVWARSRMFLSGRDTALADTLRRQAGFSLEIPNVYRWRQVSDSAYVFLNDNPDASQLVRWLTVTWSSGTEGEPMPESAIDWRDSVAERLYDWGQITQRDRIETRPVAAPGEGGIQLRGAWTTLDEFPQGGPFITRVVDCPDQNRRYLLDAWLYAPARDKYQYIIQLETLLEGFQCAG
jgi:hypothetical protein